MEIKFYHKCLLMAQLICLSCSLTYGQDKVEEKHIKDIEESIRIDINRDTTNLITRYTFRRVFAKEFSNVLLGENSFSAATRFATLKVDKDKSSVAFSPLVFIWRKPERGIVKYFGNISLKGEVNSSGITTLLDGDGYSQNYEAAFNINWLPKKGGGNKYNPSETDLTEFRKKQNLILDQVTKDYVDLLEGASSSIVKNLTNLKSLKDVKSLDKSMRNTFSGYEEQLAEPEWTNRTKWWISASARLGRVTQNVYNINSKEIETIDYTYPSILVGPNFYKESINKRLIFFASGTYELTKKNIFSGTSAKTYNKIVALADSALIVIDKKDIYLYNEDNYNIDFSHIFTTQGIAIWENEFIPFGVDVIFKREALVVPADKDSAAKWTQNYGLIFPFNDKSGERSINIEIFYAKNTFTKDYKDREEFWGARFAIPIYTK